MRRSRFDPIPSHPIQSHTTTTVQFGPHTQGARTQRVRFDGPGDSGEGGGGVGIGGDTRTHATEQRHMLRRRMSRRCVGWLIGMVDGGWSVHVYTPSESELVGRSIPLPTYTPQRPLTLSLRHTHPHTNHNDSFSRALSAGELAEWHAEHSWRTWAFMTADHMFYSGCA